MKLILAAALLAASTTTQAAEQLDVCDAQARLAEAVMQKRQEGASLRHLINHMKASKAGLDPLTELMLEDAFQQPRYQSPEYQQRAVTEYENLWYVTCMGGNHD